MKFYILLILFIISFLFNFPILNADQMESINTQGHVTPAMLTSESPVEFDIVRDMSTVEFKGKSLMHHFTGTSHEVRGFTKGPLNNAVLTDCEIEIPVISIEGNALGKNRDDLTRNIHENLEEEKYPYITFKLSRAEPYKNVDLINGKGDYMIQGDLTIHNKTERIIFPVKMDIINGYLHFTGVYEQLNVRDYDVEPKPLMAFIKVGDHVDVKFDIYEDINLSEEPTQHAEHINGIN